MKITLDQIENKKKIGTVKGQNVYEIKLKGGLMLIANGGVNGKVLAIAPHRALARHIAKEAEPELVVDELSKSEDDLPFAMFKHVAPFWVEVTKKFNGE